MLELAPVDVNTNCLQTMQRIFGTSGGGSSGGSSGGSKKPPKPTLSDAIAKVPLSLTFPLRSALTLFRHQTDDRANQIDQKIRLLENDLRKIKEQLGKMPPGGAKNSLQQRALNILKQKRMYESQRDQLMQQSFNMEQANMAADNLRNVAITVESMREASTQLKKEYKKMNVSKIERAQDELEDLMDQANEIQEMMSRSYGVPDYLDESDLDAELAALGDDMYVAEAEPSYLTDVASPPSSELEFPSVATVRLCPH